MLAGIAGAVILIIFSSQRQTASSYIAESFNAAQNTVVIADGGSSQVYRIQLPRAGKGATQVKIGDQNVPMEELREGMVVVPGSLKAEQTATTGRVLNSIQLTYPQSVVSLSTTRQFLLAAIMVELAIILLILTQSAASTVTREKEDGTLDLLLSTPITSRYYVWGKLRGLVSFVLPLVAVPVGSIFLFVLADLFFGPRVRGVQREWTVFPEAIVILPGTLVMVSAFAAILGMQMSLRCRKTVVAVMSSVGIVALVSGLLFACGTGAATSNDFGPPGIAIGCFSPFTLMALLVAPTELISRQLANPSDAAGIRILIFFFGWIAAIAYGIVGWAMYKSMVRNFDMTIRKQAT
jgi:ABC-type Na+ efflux pump permease subunit